MATLRKRGGKWQVQVRRIGFSPRSKTFAQKRDAERWGTLQERDFDLAQSRGEEGATYLNLTLGDLLARYQSEVIPTKRAAYTERYIVAAIGRRAIASHLVRELSPEHVSRYRDMRLNEIGKGGVARELRLCQHALETARLSWGMQSLSNPFKLVRKPKEPRGRERRLQVGEEALLMKSATDCQNSLMVPLIKFALATAMRQGEILSLRMIHCDLSARVVTLPLTKNGRPRTVPLSREAHAILQNRVGQSELAFPISREAVKQAWARLTRRAGLNDLHFHDLRHEAISRLFEQGFDIPEIMMMSGHTDHRMLLRYTHLKAGRLVEKLDRVS